MLVGLKSGRALIASMPELARRRQLDDLVGDATTDQRAEPKKEPLIPSTMVCRVDERPKARRHGGQL